MSLLASAAVLAIAPTAQAADTQPRGAEAIDEVVVTGSRIARAEGAAPMQVLTIDQARIAASGSTNLGEILKEIPALANGVNATSATFFSTNPERMGVSNINLRGLGVTRTLVLVNGRRYPGSGLGTGAVDLNTIPTDLISRVETVTGGASAIYGSDAVSGLVNITIDDRFVGVRANARVGGSEEGGAANQHVSLAGATRFSADRGRVWASYSYDNEDNLTTLDRSFTRPIGEPRYLANPANKTNADGVPARVVYNDTFVLSRLPGGVVFLPIDPVTGQKLPAGAATQPYTFVNGANGSASMVAVPYAADLRSIQAFMFQGLDPKLARPSGVDYDIKSPLSRHLVAGGGSYEITPSTKLILDGNYAKSHAVTRTASIFNDLINQVTPQFVVRRDNPFLPAQLADAMDRAGLTSVNVGRRDGDLGNRSYDNNRELYRLTAGLQGEIGGWRYDAYAQHGSSKLDITNVNEVVNARFLQSLDVVRDASGKAACRNPANGCVPFNPFGDRTPTEVAALKGFFGATLKSALTQKQDVAAASATRDLFQLPAGPFGVAAGVEYRRESTAFQVDPLAEAGGTFAGNVQKGFRGKFDVAEGYLEARAPLLKGLPAAEELTVEGAVRVADYSTSGTATSWRFATDWSPLRDLHLRGTVARSVRAPNISELYAPGADSNIVVTHPCSASVLNTAGPNRVANCQARGYPANFSGSFGSTNVSTVGDDSLSPETAKTYTLGFTFQPRFVPRLSVSVDYWDTTIKDGISSFAAQTVANLCFDSAAGSNPFCDSISFLPSGQFERITVRNLNVASMKAAGIDIDARYIIPLDRLPIGGDLTLQATATHLDKLEQRLSATLPLDPIAGEHGYPKWKGMLRASYQTRSLRVSADANYLQATVYDDTETIESRSPLGTGDVWYFNARASYVVREGVEVYGGVNNLTNREPPFLPDVFRGANFSVYDVVGRAYYAGVRLQF